MDIVSTKMHPCPKNKAHVSIRNRHAKIRGLRIEHHRLIKSAYSARELCDDIAPEDVSIIVVYASCNTGVATMRGWSLSPLADRLI